MFPPQLEGVPPARVHEGEERGEEDLRGPQGVDGHLRDRLQVQVRQACTRPSHLRSPLLPGQGKSPFFLRSYEFIQSVAKIFGPGLTNTIKSLSYPLSWLSL